MSTGRAKRRFLRLLIAALLAWWAVLIFAHPWFAITRPSGGDSLVVEGWMHRQGIEEAARTFQRGGYDRILTTGTVRPFAYYLRLGDTVAVRFAVPVSGTVEMSLAGLPRAWVQMHTDRQRTAAAIGVGSSRHRIELRNDTLLLLVAGMDTSDPQEAPVAFISGLRLNGMNVHALRHETRIRHADGSESRGTPSFAHQGLERLVESGIPSALITAVPTWRVERSRTYSCARDLTAFADSAGIGAYDVATLAVHARRTWRMHRVARGQRPGAGVIALDDRWCRRWSWWGNYYGWFQMLKELAALPAPWLVDQAASNASGD